MNVGCPYCGKGLEICHDDGFGYEEGVKHHQECPHCEKVFVFETFISFYYEPQKSDCLNDGKHNYEKTTTFPEEFSEMECTTCGDRRELTDSERAELNIGTKESYFESLNAALKIERKNLLRSI